MEDEDIFDGDEISLAHRAREQRHYEAQYQEWVSSLPPSERKRLAGLGLDRPDGDIQQINGKRRSIEDMPLAEELAEIEHAASPAQVSILTRALLELANCGNVPLYLDVMLSALSVYEYEGKTCEELGAKHGVSKQRFDFLRNRFIDAFGLPAPAKGRDIKRRTLESLQRTCKSNSPSLSQRKSAAYTPRSSPGRKLYSLPRSRSGKN